MVDHHNHHQHIIHTSKISDVDERCFYFCFTIFFLSTTTTKKTFEIVTCAAIFRIVLKNYENLKILPPKNCSNFSIFLRFFLTFGENFENFQLEKTKTKKKRSKYESMFVFCCCFHILGFSDEKISRKNKTKQT